MAKELTTIACEKLKARSNRYEMPDGRIGGLRIVVQPSGRKSWAFRFKTNGKSRKLTIGPFPAIGLATARERAGRAKDAIAKGAIPTPKRRQSARRVRNTIRSRRSSRGSSNVMQSRIAGNRPGVKPNGF
jgi:Arm DNA-binding domain